ITHIAYAQAPVKLSCRSIEFDSLNLFVCFSPLCLSVRLQFSIVLVRLIVHDCAALDFQSIVVVLTSSPEGSTPSSLIGLFQSYFVNSMSVTHTHAISVCQLCLRSSTLTDSARSTSICLVLRALCRLRARVWLRRGA